MTICAIIIHVVLLLDSVDKEYLVQEANEQTITQKNNSHFLQSSFHSAINLKALSHGAIFLATCNAVVFFVDVKLANISFYHSLLI